mmetsp:Transcript_2200/g.3302  ORF Transcript_2200/g.3302 Transcript_2200/m.3302 type:complete len:111 (+) Transcript_2200:738-1070(+)
MLNEKLMADQKAEAPPVQAKAVQTPETPPVQAQAAQMKSEIVSSLKQVQPKNTSSLAPANSTHATIQKKTEEVKAQSQKLAEMNAAAEKKLQEQAKLIAQANFEKKIKEQ